jgi:NADH-quinone oxidoreductase subunit H
VVVLMVSGSLNLTDIVMGRARAWPPWAGLPVLELAAAAADVHRLPDLGRGRTNRHPFDVVEGESEIVAGHMVEYSGMGFAIFFLAEYASMWLVSILAVIMFLGGWLAPVVPGFHPGLDLAGHQDLRGGVHVHLDSRHLPALPYDQIMRLGWKIFIPSRWCGWCWWARGCTALEHLELSGRLSHGFRYRFPFSLRTSSRASCSWSCSRAW